MKQIYYIFIFLTIGYSIKERGFPSKKELTELEKTSFAYTADDTLRSNVNYIYSPTLLFAWNHLLEETKSSLLHGSEFAQSIDTALGHLNSLNEDEYEKSFIIESPHFIVTTSFQSHCHLEKNSRGITLN